jgi:hypothetical protein
VTVTARRSSSTSRRPLAPASSAARAAAWRKRQSTITPRRLFSNACTAPFRARQGRVR